MNNTNNIKFIKSYYLKKKYNINFNFIYYNNNYFLLLLFFP